MEDNTPQFRESFEFIFKDLPEEIINAYYKYAFENSIDEKDPVYQFFISNGIFAKMHQIATSQFVEKFQETITEYSELSSRLESSAMKRASTTADLLDSKYTSLSNLLSDVPERIEQLLREHQLSYGESATPNSPHLPVDPEQLNAMEDRVKVHIEKLFEKSPAMQEKAPTGALTIDLSDQSMKQIMEAIKKIPKSEKKIIKKPIVMEEADIKTNIKKFLLVRVAPYAIVSSASAIFGFLVAFWIRLF